MAQYGIKNFPVAFKALNTRDRENDGTTVLHMEKKS